MGYRIVVWLAVLCAGFAVAASGQEENAPQILSADLAPRQVVEKAELTVNFVVVDSDKVVKVTIDGKPETITPADTVLIEKKFRFKKGRTVVRVEAEDEKGNKRVREFLVAFGVPLEAEKAEEKPPEFTVKILVEGRLETDGNPTKDFGFPGFLKSQLPEELQEIQGQIDDADQPDDRTTLKAIVAMNFGRIGGFAGVVDTSYAKPENERIGWRVFLLGGQFKLGKPDEGGFQIGITLIDLDVGGFDFSLLAIPSVGFEFRSEDDEGSKRILYSLELNISVAAEGLVAQPATPAKEATDTQPATAAQPALFSEDGTGFTLKRVVNFKDKAKQDSWKSTLAIGDNPGGFDADAGGFDDPHRFLSYDADWENVWDSGFRLDIGYGVGYKDYPDDTAVLTTEFLGDHRVDIPLRFSLGLGWQFNKDWSAIYNYEYNLNLSNDKLFERPIFGLVVKGAF